MEYPLFLALDPSGAAIVGDQDAPAILKATPDGQVQTLFKANKQFRTPLNRPRGVAVDDKGDCFYRVPGTNFACAVGCLIPDEQYEEAFDAEAPVPLRDIVSEVFTKVQNIGEWYAPLNRYIPYPGSTKSTPPSGSYDMWSYQSFGNSTAYRQNMENWLEFSNALTLRVAMRVADTNKAADARTACVRPSGA